MGLKGGYCVGLGLGLKQRSCLKLRKDLMREYCVTWQRRQRKIRDPKRQRKKETEKQRCKECR